MRLHENDRKWLLGRDYGPPPAVGYVVNGDRKEYFAIPGIIPYPGSVALEDGYVCVDDRHAELAEKVRTSLDGQCPASIRCGGCVECEKAKLRMLRAKVEVREYLKDHDGASVYARAAEKVRARILQKYPEALT